MKIFKFIKKIFQNLRRCLKECEFFESMIAMGVVLFAFSAVVYIIGLVANFFGCHSETSSIFEKGLYSLIMLMFFVAWSFVLFLIGQGLYKVFRYFKNIWDSI